MGIFCFLVTHLKSLPEQGVNFFRGIAQQFSHASGYGLPGRPLVLAGPDELFFFGFKILVIPQGVAIIDKQYMLTLGNLRREEILRNLHTITTGATTSKDHTLSLDLGGLQKLIDYVSGL